MKVAVVIPAYQAARHLSAVVTRVRQVVIPGLFQIVIVNDGSTDETASVARAVAHVDQVPVQIINRSHNGGYGAAMKDGLASAIAAGADVVACVHADGQYSPEVLPRLLDERHARDLDVLQGSRIAPGTALTGGMPVYKYVGNAILNRLENLILGLNLSDYHSGYLIYGPRSLARLPISRLSNSFDFDLEILATARAHGLAVGEAPIPTHYGDEVSHLNPMTYGLRVLRILWRYSRRDYHPA